MEKSFLKEHFDASKESFFEEWKEFLKFQSISPDPAYAKDCQKCATWLQKKLISLGFESELIQTSQHPVVFAERKGPEGAPVIVLYGHYDVQPVDPLDLWESPPFEPVLRNSRMYARGAQDNKGQLMYGLHAVETLIKQDALPCTLKYIIEGGEECGSPGLGGILDEWGERFEADILIATDSGTLSKDLNTITMGFRGVVGLTARLSGLRSDLHSGVHGGVAPNPATEMARLIASFHNPDGSIAVEGFYDDIEPVSEEDLAVANSIPVSDEMYISLSGVPPVGGEKGYSFAERRGLRPTIEVNGIHSGYNGPGQKTIIPAHSVVKLTSRIVAGQDPKKILSLIEKHLQKNTPEGLTLEFSEQEAGGPALCVSSSSTPVHELREVLSEVGTGTVAFMWEGGSVPILTGLSRVCKAEPVLFGFGLEEDNIHAPNESFSLEMYEYGFLSMGLFLSRQGKLS